MHTLYKLFYVCYIVPNNVTGSGRCKPRRVHRGPAPVPAEGAAGRAPRAGLPVPRAHAARLRRRGLPARARRAPARRAPARAAGPRQPGPRAAGGPHPVGPHMRVSSGPRGGRRAHTVQARGVRQEGHHLVYALCECFYCFIFSKT